MDQKNYIEILNKFNGGVLILQADQIKFVNQRLAKLLGYQRETLEGSDFRGHLTEASIKDLENYIYQIQDEFAIHEPSQIDIEIFNSIGIEHEFTCSCHPFDFDGEETFVCFCNPELNIKESKNTSQKKVDR